MTTTNMLNNRTVASIMDEFFGADEHPSVVFCDAGNGCAYGEAGQVLDYDRNTMADLVMTDIPDGEDRMSNDGFESSVQSKWQHGANGYRWRVRF